MSLKNKPSPKGQMPPRFILQSIGLDITSVTIPFISKKVGYSLSGGCKSYCWIL